MCGRAVEVEPGERGGELEQETGTIEPGDLHHGVAVRPVVVDRHLGLDCERLDAALRRWALRQQVRNLDGAGERLLDGVGDARSAPSLVLIVIELARERD